MARFETPHNKRDIPPHHERAASSEPSERVGARKWNSWWSRRSPRLVTNDSKPVCVGIDAGSKTIKLVALDAEGQIVYALYHRHRSDVMSTLAEIIHDAIWRYGDLRAPVAVTGSAGIALADALGIPFVQEVVATTCAVRQRYPEADCIIELGGEDAKITYLSGNLEQRMNATCAGGTGDFIDGIASMLGIRTREISKVALGSQRTYPIASRCAVFAQTDVRPLVNAGATKADLARSALEAVVDQTLTGLACGRPIRGTVVFLGGPLEHIPALVLVFRRKLGLTAQTGIKPVDAHLYTAMGAIWSAKDAPTIALSDLEKRAQSAKGAGDGAGCLPALFDCPEQIESFFARHATERVARAELSNARGPLYLGFDAGSTSMKYALIDSNGALVASDYRNVEGDTFDAACKLMEQALLAVQSQNRYGRTCSIAQAAVTGYGEDLLRAGLGFDLGVVETVAHLRAARHFQPDVSFVLDIGGQDMKALWVRDGRIADAVLNEACSSGCGAFVQSSAKSLMLTHDAFTREAFAAARPVDLGAKCTVFMTSRVRHAQKAGSSAGDIAAGIAYSVVNNVMTRIIGKNHALPLGQSVVVQGGAFKSDAVLRAFEKVAGVEARRPDTAHLMGALGAALVARDEHRAMLAVGEPASAAPPSSSSLPLSLAPLAPPSSLVALEELHALKPRRSSARCTGCGNACVLAIVDFGDGRRYTSGNRCERANAIVFGEDAPPRLKAPNVVALEQALLARFGDQASKGPRGKVVVGLLNVLNAYENMPFWHTLFCSLGFTVIVPDDEQAAHLRGRAAETVPSESVCHPAKISHLRYLHLVERGADVVFAPTYTRGTRCPVACGYALALADNVADPRLATPELSSIRPDALVRRDGDVALLHDLANSWLDGKTGPNDEGRISAEEFALALEAAVQAQQAFVSSLECAAEKALAWASADPSRRVAVLAGRPYHVDPAILHRIDEELVRLGFAAVPQAALDAKLRACQTAPGLWKPSKRLLALVRYAAAHDQVEVVALRSFGCGYDAVSFDEAHEAARALGRPFTELKIDDIADTAHIRIRLRTLAYATSAAGHVPAASGAERKSAPTAGDALAFAAPAAGESVCAAAIRTTPDLCSTAKALIEQAAHDLEANPAASKLAVSRTCLKCLTDALPFELSRLFEALPLIEERPVPAPSAPAAKSGKRKVGLVGNPLLVFNPQLNDHIEDLVARLGWQAVYPDRTLVEVEDVRYLEQLSRFQEQGVERVIYLQSFGCLKGHVQSRGALHELNRRFPELPITIIDYDPESSALNRENRIRLALSD